MKSVKSKYRTNKSHKYTWVFSSEIEEALNVAVSGVKK